MDYFFVNLKSNKKIKNMKHKFLFLVQSTHLQVHHPEQLQSPKIKKTKQNKNITTINTYCWNSYLSKYWLLTESLPVAGNTGCNHNSDSCSHNLLLSDRSTMMGNSQDKPVAAGTDCTGHTHSCILNWTDPFCALTAAVGSLNSRERRNIQLNIEYCLP